MHENNLVMLSPKEFAYRLSISRWTVYAYRSNDQQGFQASLFTGPRICEEDWALEGGKVSRTT